MKQYISELCIKVRDYECDIQGIVNNANYQHYLEFARHEFLESKGIKFYEMHKNGIDPVVARINIEYKIPLKNGDKFICKLYIKKDGLKYIFYQDIFRAIDDRLCLKAIVICVCLVNGNLSECHEFDKIFLEINK